jgi:hypothetical protein
MMREIYLKRMRDTYLSDKVFVRNTEYITNFQLLYLNYYRGENVISDKEEDDDVQDNDLEEDTASVPEVLDQYEKVSTAMRKSLSMNHLGSVVMAKRSSSMN